MISESTSGGDQPQEISSYAEEIKALHADMHELRAAMQRLDHDRALEEHILTLQAAVHEIRALLIKPTTSPRATEEAREKTRAKSNAAPDWDKLPEWLPQKEAAKIAGLCVNTFKPWARSHRIRTRPYGKRKRFLRDDIRGIKQ
jgi:hypothetical protein